MPEQPRWFDRVDLVERAHLRDARGFSPPVHRFAAPPELAPVVRRFWVPVWDLPPGEETVQRVLQYPVCQVVVGHAYARVVGPHRGLGTQHLTGSGWVVGAMMQPAAGAPLLGRPVSTICDTHVALTQSQLPQVDALVDRVREVMAPDPADPGRQQQAVTLLGRTLLALVPVDEEGDLVNAVVAYVEENPDVLRVGQICEKFALGERSLQRLTSRRIGLSPKWLIQRRRLHDVAGLLRAGDRVDLARVAADLGYTDQAHLTRDFRAVTGLTPGGFRAEPRPG